MMRPHAAEYENRGQLSLKAKAAQIKAAERVHGVANWIGLRCNRKTLERDLQLVDVESVLLHKQIAKWDPRNSGPAKKAQPSRARVQELLKKAAALVATSRERGSFVGAALEM
eukprot:COSAG06_NODE_47268_length_340_cov_0.863071_1_plen_112_part_11